MADLERKGTATAPATTTPATAEAEGLPALVGRLGDDVMTLVDTKLSLLKVELKEEATAYLRGAVFIVAGGVITLVGLALINVALACFVSTLFTFERAALNFALGFVITGAAYVLIGGLVVMVMKNRLTARNPVPDRTVEEFRKDKQWLKNEI